MTASRSHSYRAWAAPNRNKAAQKRAREYEARLKELTVSEAMLENGAKFYKLKGMPADGAEFVESWEWRRL